MFPRSGINSDKVVIKGAKQCVDGAIQAINEVIEDLVRMILLNDCWMFEIGSSSYN